MYDLFQGFEFIRSYIDDFLILTKRVGNDHLTNLELMPTKLK